MNKTLSTITSGLAAGLTIYLLSWLNHQWAGYSFLMAPLGATAVLVFAVPESELASTRNVILGHLITAFVGVGMLKLLGNTDLAFGCGVGLGVFLMASCRLIHPPAGANPIFIIASESGWDVVLTPVLTGAIILSLFGYIMRETREVNS